jgi:hypothetical protein
MSIDPMSFYSNLGLDRSSRLASYAGYVVLRTRLRAHQCALAIGDPHIFCPLSQSVFVPIWDPIGPAVWPHMLDM